MSTEFLKSVPKYFKQILRDPPYLIFLFVSTFLLITSIIFQYNFETIWVFFLYSVAGNVWRHAQKDIMKNVFYDEIDKENRKRWSGRVIRIIYHGVNVALTVGLLIYLLD